MSAAAEQPLSTPPTNSATSPAGAPSELPKQYRPADHEPRVWDRWIAAKAFHADPMAVKANGGTKEPYCILIPPPNVTAALHLGHALNNTLQDVLVRAHRMKGFETLWMPGTDHAGIATQAVVEKRLRKEGKLKGALKQAMGRDEFVGHVQAFKDEYEAVITGQLQKMGCSCDWDRQRFTMDSVCARAVREAFFILFRDGLIYRGKRLVNWDPALQTAVADDECYDEEVDSSFWYLKYPLSAPVKLADGTTIDHVTVATTRPETYLGDTAVAINPKDPRAAALVGKMVRLPLINREIPIVADSYAVLPEAMATNDEEKNDPKAKFSTGFVKITPAHDQNDYALWQRHLAEIPLGALNMMSPDGRVSDKHGWTDVGDAREFVGMKMADARKAVAKAFEARGQLERIQPYRQNKKFSDRSKAEIEPYLSDQWYVRVTDPRMAAAANAALVACQRGGESTEHRAQSTDSEGSAGIISTGAGISAPEGAGSGAQTGTKTVFPGTNGAQAGTKTVFAGTNEANPGTKTVFPGTFGANVGTKTVFAGTKGASVGTEGTSAGLKSGEGTPDSQAALGDGSMRFYPARYAKSFEHWHDNIRDWCISRQLWWGHRIPVWSKHFEFDGSNNTQAVFAGSRASDAVFSVRYINSLTGEAYHGDLFAMRGEYDVFVCIASDELAESSQLEASGFTRDPDVLDTWFSSGLWPLSTLGWPDAALAAKETGIHDFPRMLDAFNPSTVLCTAREIITLWVSRMMMFNRYLLGSPALRAGRMSDGAGAQEAEPQRPGSESRATQGGPPPFRDVFIHAVIQDGEGRKMSKSLGNGVDPLDIIATHGADAMRFAMCQLSTDTQDVRLPVTKDPQGRNTSPKFDLGRNFATKLWNATKFAMEKMTAKETGTLSDAGKRALSDRWILSRLTATIAACDKALANYEFSDYAQACYTFLWNDFCDWYLEAIKPTVGENPSQQAVLRTTLDAVLRLLHPAMPFVTETIYESFSQVGVGGAGVAGLRLDAPRKAGLLATAGWPVADCSLADPAAEAEFGRVQALVTAVREVKAQHNAPYKRKVSLHMPQADITALGEHAALVVTLCNLEAITAAAPSGASAPITIDAREYHVSNLADAAAVDTSAEKARLEKVVAELDKSAGTLRGRLNNPGYTDKAPPHMVQQTRDQLAKVEAELAAARRAMEGA